MDINTQNSSGMMNGMPPTMHEEKKIGPIIGTLIIVIVIIIAALYFFGKRLDNNPVQNNSDITPPAVYETNTLPANADNAVDESTLNADLDSQLKDIDSSF